MAEQYHYFPVEFAFDARSALLGAITLSDATKIKIDWEAEQWRNEWYMAHAQLKGSYVVNPVYAVGTRYGRLTYSTDAALYVQTPTYEADGLRGIAAIDIRTDEPTGTTVRLRVGDGDSSWKYWDGGSWSDPGDDSDWSTQAEVVANLDAYVQGKTKVAFQLELKTTDQYETPSLYAIRMIVKITPISWKEDLVANAMVTDIRDNVRPITVAQYYLDADTTTIAMKDLYGPLESSETEGDDRLDYDIQGIDAVFNLTDDPTRQTNLLSSYNSTTKIITLSGEQDEDDLIEIQSTYRPWTAYHAEKDIFGIGLPFVAFDSPAIKNSFYDDYHQVYGTEPDLYSLPGMETLDLDFDVRMSAKHGEELDRLMTAVINQWYPQGQTLRCPITGQYVTISISQDEPYSMPERPNYTPEMMRSIMVKGYKVPALRVDTKTYSAAAPVYRIL